MNLNLEFSLSWDPNCLWWLQCRWLLHKINNEFMSHYHICTQCTCGVQLQPPVFEAKLLCDVLMIGSVVHGGFCLPPFRNVTFHYRRSSTAYFGGMCSVSRGVGVNEVRFTIQHGPNISVSMHIAVCVSDLWSSLLPQYGNSLAMAGSLSQSLAQNLGIQWDPASKRSTYCSYLKNVLVTQVIFPPFSLCGMPACR